MNEIGGQTPVLAMPSRPEGRLTLRQFLRVVRDNTLATYPPEAFDEGELHKAPATHWLDPAKILQGDEVKHDTFALCLRATCYRQTPQRSFCRKQG